MAKVLIIDDKPMVRQLLAEELAFRGYTVIAIGDTTWASVKEELILGKPDLVVLDLYLDGCHRWDLLEEIKRQNPFVPVLLVTGSGSYGRTRRTKAAEGLFMQSFELDDLLHKVAAIINRKQEQSLWVDFVDRPGIHFNTPSA